MIMQDRIWVLTLAGIGLVALVFIYVIANAGKPAASERVQSTAYAIRRWWFLTLIVLGVGVAWATLEPFPIANQREPSPGAQVVEAVGSQWAWKLSEQRLKAGIPVEFNVTSLDVNHGFAIYGPNDRIVTQVQAMPGFTNRLLYTFTRPGKYRVLCLEYCGLAHHGMTTEFEVVAAGSGGRP